MFQDFQYIGVSIVDNTSSKFKYLNWVFLMPYTMYKYTSAYNRGYVGVASLFVCQSVFF